MMFGKEKDLFFNNNKNSQRKMTLIINNEVGERLVTQEESSS